MSKLKKNEQIKNIMTRDPVTITLQTTFTEIAEMFMEKRIHHLPVVSGKKIVGLFSNTDMLRMDYSDSFGQDRREALATLDSSKSLEEAMTTNLVTISEKDTVSDAAKKLCGGDFHSLPVVDDENNLVGIVTSTDIIRYLAELY